MSDIISRADAIEAVAKLQKYDLDERNRLRIYAPWHKPKRIFVETEAIYKTIYTLPSAEAEWIPCIERLPEPAETVLVTSDGGYVYTSNIVHGEWEYGGRVIAWMPQPKPYKGGDDK